MGHWQEVELSTSMAGLAYGSLSGLVSTAVADQLATRKCKEAALGPSFPGQGQQLLRSGAFMMGIHKSDGSAASRDTAKWAVCVTGAACHQDPGVAQRARGHSPSSCPEPARLPAVGEGVQRTMGAAVPPPQVSQQPHGCASAPCCSLSPGERTRCPQQPVLGAGDTAASGTSLQPHSRASAGPWPTAAESGWPGHRRRCPLGYLAVAP